ncbi:MAG: hypothetical protein ABI823_16275 [Bryobacteraceae bacterium]
MTAVGRFLRGLSYLFHLALCIFFLGVAIVTWGASNFEISALPWEGTSLSAWLLWLSLIGLVSTLLALTGRFRYLFPIWCLFAFGLAFWGFFLNAKTHFDGESAFKNAIWLTAGLLVAAIVSLPLLRTRRY